MGLDMYAKTTAEEIPPTDFDGPEDSVEIHYWRKHPNLHGWMERLYRNNGGVEDTFNVVNVRLFADDLTNLEMDIRAGKLPRTSGFFFGQSDGSEQADDLKFIEDAKGAIESGLKVYYTSWW